MEGDEAIVNITRTAGGKLRWTKQMEVLLIDIWQENIEELRGARKNVHIYMEMAQTLMEAGFDVSYKDVRTKIENLTKMYRQEKNNMGPSGGAPSSWQHYELVHSFLGAYRSITWSRTPWRTRILGNTLWSSWTQMTGKPLPAAAVNAQTALRPLLSAQSSRKTGGAESADGNIVEDGRQPGKIPI
ncbi:uncharacterized protein [Drosophila suzukii]|uniref:Uncharacterized protein isoform X1 n=1 Tax=Drosophila suzukii TaxID=28584 RepID=A0ABM4TXW9_DROSZ